MSRPANTALAPRDAWRDSRQRERYAQAIERALRLGDVVRRHVGPVYVEYSHYPPLRVVRDAVTGHVLADSLPEYLDVALLAQHVARLSYGTTYTYRHVCGTCWTWVPDGALTKPITH